ncbi:MAG: methyl-accepting chemotaxis protein [Candidatus Competibacterales bacterium]
MNIITRLTLLIVVPILSLAALAFLTLQTLTLSNDSLGSQRTNIDNLLTVQQLGNTVNDGLVITALDVAVGAITWEAAAERLATANQAFEGGWSNYLAGLTGIEAEFAQDVYGYLLTDVRSAFAEMARLVAARDREQLALFIRNDFEALTAPYQEALTAGAAQLRAVEARRYNDTLATLEQFTTIDYAVSTGSVLLALLMGLAVYRSIRQPLRVIANTVQQVGGGDFEARTRLTGNDELHRLGQALDQLLEDRMNTLSEAQRENEMLNNSIISLLQAVYQLSQRDLTVRVPVTEDVTGPLADALNLLTDETAKVLGGVDRLSSQVTNTSDKVRTQSETVIKVASDERREVETTAQELQDAATAMARIADLAKTCDQAAERAIATTRLAVDTLNATGGGINNTRDRIRETEKRIKRLGERSQEIGTVVGLINGIAERTHILALNASMHAASAGEAGRGFAVVATEVQRLAENAREATAQIATLVSNIQAETNDAVETMSATISEVVEGSRLAEEAGSQMRLTQETTADLVLSVQQIATRSQEQAEISRRMTQRADVLRESTRQSTQQLQEQRQQTDNLVRYARELVESIRVFKLPQGSDDQTDAASRAA